MWHSLSLCLQWLPVLHNNRILVNKKKINYQDLLWEDPAFMVFLMSFASMEISSAANCEICLLSSQTSLYKLNVHFWFKNTWYWAISFKMLPKLLLNFFLHLWFPILQLFTTFVTGVITSIWLVRFSSFYWGHSSGRERGWLGVLLMGGEERSRQNSKISNKKHIIISHQWLMSWL